MKETSLTLIFIFLILLVSTVSALETDIQIQDSFGLNEDVSFDYTLTSDVNQNVIFYPYVDCPTAPLPSFIEQTEELQGGVLYTDTYSSFTVLDFIEPQTCTAYVQILSPVEQRVEKTFDIITDPSFDFEIELDKKVFVKGEDVEIDYQSSIDELGIVAKLIYPDMREEEINLPLTITASQIGTYIVESTASKSGYKDVVVREQFGVIVKEADIKSVAPGEAGVGIDDKSSRWIFYLIGGLILMVLVFIILIKFVFRKFKED